MSRRAATKWRTWPRCWRSCSSTCPASRRSRRAQSPPTTSACASSTCALAQRSALRCADSNRDAVTYRPLCWRRCHARRAPMVQPSTTPTASQRVVTQACAAGVRAAGPGLAGVPVAPAAGGAAGRHARGRPGGRAGQGGRARPGPRAPPGPAAGRCARAAAPAVQVRQQSLRGHPAGTLRVAAALRWWAAGPPLRHCLCLSAWSAAARTSGLHAC